MTDPTPRSPCCSRPMVVEISDEIVHDPPPRRVRLVGYCQRCRKHVEQFVALAPVGAWTPIPAARWGRGGRQQAG